MRLLLQMYSVQDAKQGAGGKENKEITMWGREIYELTSL
jgi:hypothetical protein